MWEQSDSYMKYFNAHLFSSLVHTHLHPKDLSVFLEPELVLSSVSRMSFHKPLLNIKEECAYFESEIVTLMF